MRLQAKEDEVYHLMDLKEWFSILIGLGSFFEGIALYFFIFRIRVWDLAYLCVALILGILFLLRQTASISRRIMEAEYCYMELEPDSLAVCQPEKNGRYESCRIFYQEIDKIVEGSRRGIPEFYVVLKETDQERESFFLLDDEEQKRNIFCVRSFGFDHEDFIHFYRKFRWNVPGRVRIIGTKNQEVWNLRKPNTGMCLMAALFLGYVVPKLLEVMKLF